MWEKALETNTATPIAVVNGLIEGNEYQFRVIALNKAGQSDPSDASKTFTAKPRFRKYSHTCIHTQIHIYRFYHKIF